MVHSCIHQLIFICDIVIPILNEKLKIGIKEYINHCPLETACFQFCVPVSLYIIILFKYRYPFCLILLNGFTAEKVVLQQFRCSQIHAQGIDSIEDLLFILIFVQINFDKLRICHDCHNIQFRFIEILDKEIERLNNSGAGSRIVNLFG